MLLTSIGGSARRSLSGVLPAAPIADQRPSFTTTFAPNAENPLSDGGRFFKSANWWANCRTIAGGGGAYGLNGPLDRFDDAYAIVVGATGDYELEGTVRVDGALNTGIAHEIELNFCIDETGGTGGGVRLLEFLFNFQGQLQGFEWNHPASGAEGGTFSDALTIAGSQQKGSNMVTGDVIKARRVGTTYTLFINGTQIGQVTNSRFTTGPCGIAFFTRPGGNSLHYRLSQLKVTPL